MRGLDEGERLARHLHRAVELAEILDSADVDDAAVDVTGRRPLDVASAVLAHVPREG